MAEQVITLKGFDELLARAPFNPRKMRRAKQRGVKFSAEFLRAELMKVIPVRSGQTRSRITSHVRTVGLGATGTIEGIVGGKSIAPGGYNILFGLEEGTGLWGPKKQRIVPVRAKALRFTVGAGPVSGTGGEVVFARSVKGIKPLHMFRNTKKDHGDRARRLFAKRFAEEVRRT